MHIPARDNTPTMVHEYGCTACQTFHVHEMDPELYKSHLLHQSKHGCRERPATIDEIFAIEMKRQDA